jgi:hypothetical protein
MINEPPSCAELVWRFVTSPADANPSAARSAKIIRVIPSLP